MMTFTIIMIPNCIIITIIITTMTIITIIITTINTIITIIIITTIIIFMTTDWFPLPVEITKYLRLLKPKPRKGYTIAFIKIIQTTINPGITISNVIKPSK